MALFKKRAKLQEPFVLEFSKGIVKNYDTMPL